MNSEKVIPKREKGLLDPKARGRESFNPFGEWYSPGAQLNQRFRVCRRICVRRSASTGSKGLAASSDEWKGVPCVRTRKKESAVNISFLEVTC